MNGREETRLARISTAMGSVDLMHARYLKQVFAPHFHEGYCLGVIERGALGFRYMGENLVAPAGAVNLAIPGEVHTGQAADAAGWTYRMFYLETDLLDRVVRELTGKRGPLPFIGEGVLFDSQLAAKIHHLHRAIIDRPATALKRESGLLDLLAHLLHRHSRPRLSLRGLGREPQAVSLARAYIHAHYDQDISVGELAAESGLSPYHFIRVFARQTGLTPHAYLIQVRVARARQRLLAGESPSQAALASGFFDQSHLTRHFKRIVGTTPGRFRQLN